MEVKIKVAWSYQNFKTFYEEINGKKGNVGSGIR